MENNYDQYEATEQVTGHCFSESRLSKQNGLSACATTKDFLKLECLNFICLIPIVGTITYLIVLLVLAFSDSTAISIKSYAKARLIMSLIATAACIVFLIIFLSIFMNSMNMIMSY